jgi:hypothetical protein
VIFVGHFRRCVTAHGSKRWPADLIIPVSGQFRMGIDTLPTAARCTRSGQDSLEIDGLCVRPAYAGSEATPETGEMQGSQGPLGDETLTEKREKMLKIIFLESRNKNPVSASS